MTVFWDPSKTGVSYSGDVVSTRKFGIVGDGRDETVKMQTAFSEMEDGQILEVYGTPRISAGLTVSASNVLIRGSTGYTKPAITCSEPGVQMVTATGFRCNFENLGFIGDASDAFGTGATVKGIRYVRGDGSKDIDSRVAGCTLSKMAEAVYGKGANLELVGNLIASSLKGLLFERNGADECRGVRVRGNRFHSMGNVGLASVCVTLPDDSFNCEVDENFSDSLYTFYAGPVNGITVDNNKLYRVAGPAIEISGASYISQQRCGSVSWNLIYANAPSYVGVAISLQMQNGRCVGNNIVGPREHGIELISTTGSLISQNIIVSPNYNSAVDGEIYDGIYADANSINNLFSLNHIRSAGIQARSAINVSSATNIISGDNWIDPFYSTAYESQAGRLIANNAATASALGTLAKKLEVFDAEGASIGFLPIYTSIS